MLGPGKYDDACTLAREQTQAKMTILMVIEGVHGSGFSVQEETTDPDPRNRATKIVAVLRAVANAIEKDHVLTERDIL
jgi:hypothetical protein